MLSFFISTALTLQLSVNNLNLRDIPWGVSYNQIQVPSGFSFRHTERANTLAWSGNLDREPAVMVAGFTPRTQRLNELTFIIGNETNIVPAKARYLKYRNLLKRAYGKPSHSYDYVSAPYTKGDGKEDLALFDGKYNKSDFWNKFSKTFIGMAITPEGWTCVTFESKELSKAP